MNGSSCAQVRDLVSELALGILGGAERADALAHVECCARCQALLTEFTEAADALPFLAPEREPPRGFEQRVLAAVHARRRRVWRWWVGSAAAAAAVAVVVGVALARVVDASRDGSATAGAIPAEAQMVSQASGPVGWAYVTNGTSVAVAVGHGLEPGRYRVTARPAAGGTRTLGRIVVLDGRGSWTGRSPVALGGGSVLALVDEDGATACRGVLGRLG